MVDIDSLIDFANEAHAEIGRYMVQVTLSPEQLKSDTYSVNPLVWNSIPFGDEDLDQIPGDKRGVYAFSVCEPSDVLPPHGYVLYIGIAGRDSNRSLRERYRDYRNVKKVMKRAGIARMIADWHDVLRFFFAPVDEEVSSDELKQLEVQLNTAMMPPFSIGDLEAATKQKRRAFP